jgi:hypothetical protein
MLLSDTSETDINRKPVAAMMIPAGTTHLWEKRAGILACSAVVVGTFDAVRTGIRTARTTEIKATRTGPSRSSHPKQRSQPKTRSWPAPTAGPFTEAIVTRSVVAKKRVSCWIVSRYLSTTCGVSATLRS